MEGLVRGVDKAGSCGESHLYQRLMISRNLKPLLVINPYAGGGLLGHHKMMQKT